MNDEMKLVDRLRHFATHGTGDTYGARIIREAADLLEAETARADALAISITELKRQVRDLTKQINHLKWDM